MSEETKKMLAIINKQHKTSYEQVQRQNKKEMKKQRINLIVLNIFAIIGFILTAIAIITF